MNAPSTFALALEATFVLATIALLFFLVQAVLKQSFFLIGESAQRWISIATVASTGVAFVSYFVAFYVHIGATSALANVVGISVALVALEVTRVLLDRHEHIALEGRANINYKKNAADLSANITLYLGIYTAVLYAERPAYFIFGNAICIFNLFRVLKYRIYDDLYKRQLDISASYLSANQNKPAQAPQHVTLLQGLYNVFLRTYFFVSTTFALIYMMLISSDPSAANQLFKLEKLSGNTFVDLLYFSVFQLSMGGYGDISPVAVVPKLLCVFEMIFGYLVLGSILALILGRTSPNRQ